jgi:hypothetical protein
MNVIEIESFGGLPVKFHVIAGYQAVPEAVDEENCDAV